MTLKEKRKYLKQYRHAHTKILTIQEEIEKLEVSAEATAINYDKVSVQVSPTNDQMINYTIKHQELIDKLSKQQEDALTKCNNVIYALESLDNDLYYTILHRRYILLESWETIAYELDYSTQWIYELHAEALAEIQITE